MLGRSEKRAVMALGGCIMFAGFVLDNNDIYLYGLLFWLCILLVAGVLRLTDILTERWIGNA